MDTDGDFCSTSSTGESLKHLATGQCDDKSYRLGVQEDHRGTLDSIWYKATQICQSRGLKTFLRKHGKLSSLSVNQGTFCTLFTLVFVRLLISHSSLKFLASFLSLPTVMVSVFCAFFFLDFFFFFEKFSY